MREAAAEINDDLGREAVTPYVADLRDAGEVEALVPHLVDGGGVELLVTNAGGTASAGETLADVAQQWLDAYRLNVLTAVLITEALLPHLSRPGGRIVAMSSVSALKGAGSYGAAKAALNNWVTDLAREVAADGITVNAVAPGFVPDTGFWGRQARRSSSPAGRHHPRWPPGHARGGRGSGRVPGLAGGRLHDRPGARRPWRDRAGAVLTSA